MGLFGTTLYEFDNDGKRLCQTEIWTPSGNWGYYSQCKKKPTVAENGKWFCGIHSTEGRTKRSERSRANIDAQINKIHSEHEIQSARNKVVEAARDWVKNFPPNGDCNHDDLVREVEALNKLYAQRT